MRVVGSVDWSCTTEGHAGAGDGTCMAPGGSTQGARILSFGRFSMAVRSQVMRRARVVSRWLSNPWHPAEEIPDDC